MSEETTAAPAANLDPLAGIPIDPPPGGYPDHPLAAIFPMLPAEELAALGESIRQSGQRDDIVLFDGKVLDGRNRQAACTLAEVEPRYRNFDEATEGSPAQYVLDKNLRRRDLSQSQKAAAAAELMPHLEREAAARQEATRFQANQQANAAALVASETTPTDGTATETTEAGGGFDADTEEEKHAAEREAAGGQDGPGISASTATGDAAPGDQAGPGPGESTVDTSGEYSQVPPGRAAAKPATTAKGNSRDRAAAAMNVSPRMVQDAKTLQTQDPAKFDEVKAGKTTLGAAMKAAPSAGTKAAGEYEQALEAIGKVCGDKMVKAIKEGAILRSRKEVTDFAALPDSKMQDIKGLVDIGWSVKKALHHKTETLLPTHQIMDGISRAAQAGGTYTQLIEAPETGAAWEVTIKRKAIAAQAAPTPAPSSPATAPETPKAAAGATPAPAATKKAAQPAKAGKPSTAAKTTGKTTGKVKPQVIKPGAKKAGFKHPLAGKGGRTASGGAAKPAAATKK